MEMIDLIAILCFITIVVTGIALKRHIRHLLSDLDGLGDVKTNAEADSNGIEF